MLNAMLNDTIAICGGRNPAIDARLDRLHRAGMLDESEVRSLRLYYTDDTGLVVLTNLDPILRDEAAYRG